LSLNIVMLTESGLAYPLYELLSLARAEPLWTEKEGDRVCYSFS
jgi:hypothetical protein